MKHRDDCICQACRKRLRRHFYKLAVEHRRQVDRLPAFARIEQPLIVQHSPPLWW